MPGDGRAVGDDGPDVGRTADSRHAVSVDATGTQVAGASRQATPKRRRPGHRRSRISPRARRTVRSTCSTCCRTRPRHDRERRSAHRGRALDLLVRGRAVLGRRRVGAAHPAAV